MPWLETFLSSLAPAGMQLDSSCMFEEDERKWFQAGVEQGVFHFGPCIEMCRRFKQWKLSGADEFLTPNGGTRHLLNFDQNSPNTCFLAREYIPHIAAVSRLVIGKGYDKARYSFSLYRSFTRDLLRKKRGGSFETDAEFYDSNNSLYLHIEAKKSRRETEGLASDIGAGTELETMHERNRKELEYVLDLTPRYLWLVGPGTIEPEEFVYEVTVTGLTARLTKVTMLPDPPR